MSKGSLKDLYPEWFTDMNLSDKEKIQHISNIKPISLDLFVKELVKIIKV